MQHVFKQTEENYKEIEIWNGSSVEDIRNRSDANWDFEKRSLLNWKDL